MERMLRSQACCQDGPGPVFPIRTSIPSANIFAGVPSVKTNRLSPSRSSSTGRWVRKRL